MFFEELVKYEIITTFHYKDTTRKQPHQVIFWDTYASKG